MTFLDNVKSYFNNGSIGICPYCNSDSVKIQFQKIKNNFGYGVIWCEKCHMAYELSRVDIKEDYPQGNFIPSNLKFE